MKKGYVLLLLSAFLVFLFSTASFAQGTCEDSDEGLNAVEVGTTTYGDRSEVDYCQSGNRLVEWYCNAGGVLNFEYVGCLCANAVCDDSNLPRGETAPIYRLYNIAEVNHFYTTSEEEKNNALNLGYYYEGVIGYLSPVQTIDTLALYRLYHIEAVNHFYTINPEERDAAIRINNYNYDGVQGYIYTIKRADMVPFYRLYDSREVNHFYTTSKEERDNLIGNSGYGYEGIVGYVYPCVGEICTEGVTIQPTEGDEFFEVEPNNEFSEANDVALRLNVGDKIEIFGATLANDVDVFKLIFGASLGDYMSFDATANNLNTRAALFNGDGDLLDANDDRSYYVGDGRGRDPHISLNLREDYSELYFVIAPSVDYLTGNPGGSNSRESNYNVQVERQILPFAQTQPNPQRVLLDFDGGSVQIGLEPVENIPRWEDTWVARQFPDEQAQIKTRVIEMMKEDFADYNVEFYTTDGTLPQAPSTSIFFGGYNARFLGLADNVDSYNENLVQEAIAYTDDLELFMTLEPTADKIATAIANVASHELGHLLGLEHTREVEDLMSPASNARQLLEFDADFRRAELNTGVFPIGWQNSPKLLELGVGRKNA